jgi:hypothetical protein
MNEYKFPEIALDYFLLGMLIITILIFIAALVGPRRPIHQTQKEDNCYKETVWVCKEDLHLRGKSICRQRVVCRTDD